MKLSPLVVAVACLLALPAVAQTLKPGLWEMRHKMLGNPQMDQQMAAMQKEMAALPPEQRKQMEAMMASQGVQMGAGGPGGMTMKMCMTKEMVERNDIPANQGDCKTTQQQRSGSTMKMTFSCVNPPSTGESQITFASPEAYSMKTTATTTAGGKAEKMAMEGSGKWLGADCGNVKPVAAPKK